VTYKCVTAILNQLPPEIAHDLSIKLLRTFPVKNVLANLDVSGLSQSLMGMDFIHPIGLAAGFDKQAEVFDQLGKLGFSFLEVGSVTPKPQFGNPRPRLFRLPKQQAIINRYGFNSKGLSYFAKHLQKYQHTCVVGVNLGKNKDSVNYCDDFLQSAEVLIENADYFTINLSSPNTPGLRELQHPEAIKPVIDGIAEISLRKEKKIPIFIKISPDMTIKQETTLAEFLLEQPITGIIISNTTVARNGVEGSRYANEQGGLSGQPLKTPSTEMLRRIYRIVSKRLMLIGCGGINSGQDAYEKLRAGADLLQIYTAFVYEGPLVIRKILLELKSLMARDGVTNIREVIGEK
jgi:dihydroorotate dehydrogenase